MHREQDRFPHIIGDRMLCFSPSSHSTKKSGRSQKEIAQIIGIRPATICQWCKDYDNKGQNGLIAKKRGVKSEDGKLLSDKQERHIQKMITDTMPDQLKLNFALWTRKAVKELVERELQITIAETAMGDYLRKWGFTPQKPKKQAYEQCPKAVQKWLNEDYPLIKERVKKRKQRFTGAMKQV